MIRPDVSILIKKSTHTVVEKGVKQDFIIPIPVSTTVVEINKTSQPKEVKSEVSPVANVETSSNSSVNQVEFTTIDLTETEVQPNYVEPENLSDQQLSVLLNQMGFDKEIENEGVARDYVENLLKKLPVYINRNTSESSSRKFSTTTMRKDKILDLKPIEFTEPKVELTQPIAVINNRDINREIIDGQIKGAGFAGSNESYPVTSLDDVNNILDKLSTSEEPKDKRIIERALKIAKRMGFLKKIAFKGPYIFE